jgi:hypothetical protein
MLGILENTGLRSSSISFPAPDFRLIALGLGVIQRVHYAQNCSESGTFCGD